MSTSILVGSIIIVLCCIAIYFLASENIKSDSKEETKSDDTAVAAVPLTQDIDSSSFMWTK